MPFRFAVRIIDVFLNEGFKILFRVGLALVKMKSRELLGTNEMIEALIALKNFEFLEEIDEDEFFKVAFSFKFSRKHLAKLERQYDSIQQT